MIFLKKSFIVSFVFLYTVFLHAETKAVISVDSLNVRETPNGAKVDNLKRDTSVELVEKLGEWTQIKYDGNKSGWVSSKFITTYFEENKTKPKQEEQKPQTNIKKITTCQEEQKTKSKVCLIYKEPKMECFGSTCDVIFDYEISTNYKGKGLIYADLDFKANIKLPDGKKRDRVEQTGHNFYKIRTQKEQIKVPFYLKSGIAIDKIELLKSKAKITNIKFYN